MPIFDVSDAIATLLEFSSDAPSDASVVRPAAATALVHTTPSGPPQAHPPIVGKSSPVAFALDSGSTYHTHHCRADFSNMRPCKQSFTGSTGKKGQCDSVGDIHCLLRGDRGLFHHTFSDVYLVPSHHYSLLSVHQLQESDVLVTFGNAPCLQFSDGTTVPFAWRDYVYVLPVLPTRSGPTARIPSLALHVSHAWP